MRISLPRRGIGGGGVRDRRASVLIIVLWVAFGLVALTLYFANTTSLELRAADNQAAAVEAEMAIAGAARYVSNILANLQQPGVLPDTNRYATAAVPVGNAAFWLLAPAESNDLPTRARFGLVDESSKLNLNGATLAMIQSLPRMTAELAASIVDWRDTNDTPTDGGAESEIYMRRNPAYRCKNGPFESIDELRLVYGADLDLLYGEDANLNGVLDRNENNGETSPPFDNGDGRLDAGILDYVTVHSRPPTTGTNGTALIDVGAASLQQQLAQVLQDKFGTDRANAILRRLSPAPTGGGRGGAGGGGGGGAQVSVTFRSVLELYVRSGMTAAEFGEVEVQLRNPGTNGFVNVNTASEEVLACIPGIGLDKAQALVSQRRGQAMAGLNSVAWVKDILDEASLIQAGPYLTGRSYQVCADVVAVGRYGRGYKRVRLIFDLSQGTPAIIHRQDLTYMGWALGPEFPPGQQQLTASLR